RLARWMHRAAVVRSVNHKAGCHNPLPSYSGYEATLADITTTKDTYPPSMGAVCEYVKAAGHRSAADGDFPAYIYLPRYLAWRASSTTGCATSATSRPPAPSTATSSAPSAC